MFLLGRPTYIEGCFASEVFLLLFTKHETSARQADLRHYLFIYLI